MFTFKVLFYFILIYIIIHGFFLLLLPYLSWKKKILDQKQHFEEFDQFQPSRQIIELEILFLVQVNFSLFIKFSIWFKMMFAVKNFFSSIEAIFLSIHL